MRALAIDVLLVVGVFMAVVSTAGVVAARDLFTRLHYLGPLMTLGALAITGAVLIDQGFNVRGLQTVVVMVTFLLLQPIVTHATARASRLRSGNERER